MVPLEWNLRDTRSVVTPDVLSQQVVVAWPSAWSVSEYGFGVRTSKLTRHLWVKSLSTYSKEYVKQTGH
jgi:hypothetical protein